MPEKICLNCGDRGFTNALVYCVKCLQFAVHRYCLNVMPKSVDGYTQWLCDDCVGEGQNQTGRAFECNMGGNLGGEGPNFRDVKVRNVKQERDMELPTERGKMKMRKIGKSAAYGRIKKLKVVATRYPSNPTMDDLGIKENVMMLFEKIGWSSLVTSKWPTCVELTKEFLSTVEISKGRKQTPMSMKFKLEGKQYNLSRQEIDEMMGTPANGCYVATEGPFVGPKGLDNKRFWGEIAEDDPNPRQFQTEKMRGGSIANPVLRYIHKVLALSVFGRAENGNVHNQELIVLYCMLGGYKVTMAGMAMDNWSRAMKQHSGKVLCGGLLTPIAKALGVKLEHYTMLPPEELDAYQLTCTRYLMQINGGNFLQQRYRMFPLPNPNLTFVSDFEHRDNWLMNTPDHVELKSSSSKKMTKQVGNKVKSKGGEVCEKGDSSSQQQQTGGSNVMLLQQRMDDAFARYDAAFERIETKMQQMMEMLQYQQEHQKISR